METLLDTEKNMQSRRGFTLIELLFVISLTVIVMLGAAGLFFATLIGNSRKNITTTVKDEGNYAMNQMEFLLRNAIQIVPDPQNPTQSSCTTNMSKISFKEADNGITSLSNQNNQIASQAAGVANPQYLTSTAVQLTGPTFNCTQVQTNTGTYVTITFTLTKQSPDYITATPVTESFETSVNVRSY